MKVIWREIRKKLEGIEGGIEVVEKVERGEEAENDGMKKVAAEVLGSGMRSWAVDALAGVLSGRRLSRVGKGDDEDVMNAEERDNNNRSNGAMETVWLWQWGRLQCVKDGRGCEDESPCCC